MVLRIFARVFVAILRASCFASASGLLLLATPRVVGADRVASDACGGRAMSKVRTGNNLKGPKGLNMLLGSNGKVRAVLMIGRLPARALNAREFCPQAACSCQGPRHHHSQTNSALLTAVLDWVAIYRAT